MGSDSPRSKTLCAVMILVYTATLIASAQMKCLAPTGRSESWDNTQEEIAQEPPSHEVMLYELRLCIAYVLGILACQWVHSMSSADGFEFLPLVTAIAL